MMVRATVKVKKSRKGVVANERLTVRIEPLLPKRNSLPDLPAFLGPYGKCQWLSNKESASWGLRLTFDQNLPIFLMNFQVLLQETQLSW